MVNIAYTCDIAFVVSNDSKCLKATYKNLEVANKINKIIQ